MLLCVNPVSRLRRHAPWALLLVPLAVVAAIAGVDAVRADHDRRPPVARSEGAVPPGGEGVVPPGGGVVTPGVTPTPAGCPDSGLSVRLGGQEAAMGLRVLQIVAVNCGTAPRTVRGHPAVRLLDGDRRPLDVLVGNGSSGIATVPSFDAAPATVTLQPGERATTAILWRNLVTDASVRATLGEYLEVAVAAGEPPQVIEAEGGVDLGNTGKVGVAPWAAYR